MNFQSLAVVPQSQEILDKALARAKKKGDQLKNSHAKWDATTRYKNVSLRKINVTVDTIIVDFSRVISEFPDFENLPEFYEELCKAQFDVDDARESLGRLQGVIRQLEILKGDMSKQIKMAESLTHMQKMFSGFVGRVSSLVNMLRKPLLFLEKIRKVLVMLPTIKEGVTIALAGFPNVGKSTLLSKMTSAKPKIANYAFTTKGLNVGYYKEGYHDIQIIDTPGTLARFDKMNAIEKMAYLCLKYLADLIVIIIDPTETYSLDEQKKLIEEIKEHEKPIIYYISKTDIADQNTISSIVSEFDAISDPSTLKKQISQRTT